MALLFYDSFDHYTTATPKWTDSSSFGGSITISSSYGRHGDGLGFIGNIMQTGADPTRLRKLNMNTADHTLIVGYALYFAGGGRTVERSADPMLGIYNGSSQRVRFHLDNFLVKAYDATDSSLLAVSSAILAPNQWHYVEAKVTLAPLGTGSIEMRKNGVSILTYTGSFESSSLFADGFSIGGIRGDSFNGFNMNAYYDDVYACNASGTTNNDYVGDQRVIALFPTDTGSNTQWFPVPSTGTNYQLVDENPPNNDTDYVYESGTGRKDSYTFQDISGTVAVKGVQVNAVAAITSGTYRIIEPMAHTSGVSTGGAPIGLTLETYSVAHAPFDVDPADSGTWTPTRVNDAEFGVKIAG